MRYLNKYNEELKSDVYKSAADKLKKLGHIKRPEELMKWHEITKQKEIDALKLATLKDCQQMGIYQLSLSYRKGGQDFKYKGDYAVDITINQYDVTNNITYVSTLLDAHLQLSSA